MKRNLVYLFILLLCSCSSHPALAQQPEEEIPEKTPEQTTEEKNDEASTLTGQPVGFATMGTTPTGGEGGQHITVTNATELKNALKKAEKLIIYVKGTINMDNVISLKATNKTLLGLPGSVLTNPNRTKDTSGILYFKSGSDNLILRNLTFKSAGAYDTDGRDNLCIDGTTNIWVDHCDFQDGVDGNFDCKNASDYIAVTWCRFRYLKEPLAGGSGGSEDHRFSNLWGNSDNHTQDRGHLNTTFQYCWWDEGCRDRMPRVRFGKIHIANCLYSSTATSGCIGVGYEADVLVEKSVFAGIKKPHKVYDESGQIRFDGCKFQNSTADKGTECSFTPPYTLQTIAVEEVEDAVRTHAGATLDIKET